MPEIDVNLQQEKTHAFQRPVNVKKGAALFHKPCTFLMGAVSADALPDTDLQEIAFVGRSNVGKSSLINGLLNNKNMARTSNTPGRTQEINFFDLGGAVRLVDLPGYGHAEAPKQKVIAWQSLIKDYLRGRPNLRRAFVLIDSRHGIKTLDKEIFTLLDKAAVSYQIVLTKTDKILPEVLETMAVKAEEDLKKFIAAHPYVFQTSALRKTGFEEIRSEISLLA